MSLPALTTLLQRSQITSDSQILDAANISIKKDKNDLQARYIRIVALIKLDRLGDVIDDVEYGSAELKEKAKLEYTYALYRRGYSERGKAAQAVKLAKENDGRAYRHIAAQALYNAEDFAGAAELYESLKSNLSIDNEADLRVNSGAVDAQLEFAGQGDAVKQKKPSREDFEAYETAYNAACSSIARGELGQAEVLLKRAKNLCLAAEDLSDGEKETETRPMTIQQVYVLAKLGRLEEARTVAKEIKYRNFADGIETPLAQINTIAVTPDEDQNPYLTQRELYENEHRRDAQRFEFQDEILKRNRLALDIKTLKYEGTAATTQQNIKKVSAPTTDSYTNSLSVINAAAHARNSAGKDALKHILPLLDSRPADVGLILTIAQLYVLTNNANLAIDLLQKFLSQLDQSGNADHLDVRFAPALVGSLVSLYATNGRTERLRSELAKAAAHWRRKSKNLPGETHLLKAAGNALLESEEAEDRGLAKAIFQDLHKQDEDDRYAAAGLLAASPNDSTVDASVLVSLERLMGGIDAEALENTGIAHRPSTTTTQPSKKRAASENISRKPKKLRKSKTPKDYDPAKTADPERWLPLRDRSTYRPKGKKGKARQAMLSQGAVSNESSRPGTPGGEVVKKPQAGGGNANKKKKKGKK